jgi:hypothetical protein
MPIVIDAIQAVLAALLLLTCMDILATAAPLTRSRLLHRYAKRVWAIEWALHLRRAGK